jgi:predicted nucleic acid-binding protein
MAGHVRYTALLDACVLFPIATCNALMSVASTGIFAAKWTARIDDEWMQSLAAAKGIEVAKLAKRRDLMHDACPDWEVPHAAWQPLESCVQLPDVNDRHVLAAAMAGHADCIVTANLKDFPSEVLEPLGIEVLHPDAFLVAQIELAPLHVLPAFKAMRARHLNPAVTPEEFADSLARAGLVRTADYLRQAAGLI